MKTSCEIKYFDTPTAQAPSDNNFRMVQSVVLVDDKYIFTAAVADISLLVLDEDGHLLGGQVIEMSLEVKSRKGPVVYKGPLMGDCSNDKWKEVFFSETLSDNKLSASSISKYFKNMISHQLFVNLFNGTEAVVESSGKCVDFKHLAFYFNTVHNNAQPRTSVGAYDCGFSMGVWGDFEIRYLVTYKLDFINTPTELEVVRTFVKLIRRKPRPHKDFTTATFSLSFRVLDRVPTVEEVKTTFTESLQSIM